MKTLDVTCIDEPTVIDVWAPHCAACRAMQPDLAAVSARFRGRVERLRLNAALDAEAARRLGVMGTPTLLGVRNGGVVFRVTGRRTRAELEQLFTAVADGAPPPRTGSTDAVIRLGAGVALALVGAAAGPAWPLVGLGGVIAASGVVSVAWRR